MLIRDHARSLPVVELERAERSPDPTLLWHLVEAWLERGEPARALRLAQRLLKRHRTEFAWLPGSTLVRLLLEAYAGGAFKQAATLQRTLSTWFEEQGNERTVITGPAVAQW